MNCSYCGTGIIDDCGSCHKCGAPTKDVPVRNPWGVQHYGHTPNGTCVCGKTISNDVEIYKVTDILCHGCQHIFTSQFRAQYLEDWRYPNGQITHLYRVAGLECPNCGAVFELHEFYHGVYDTENLIDHAKRAKVSA